MSAAQVHLMLNHVPVLGALLVVVILGVGLKSRNQVLLRFALVTLVAISLAAIPVYFSGGASEESIERLAGVDRSSLERHEDVARAVVVGMGVLALPSLIALFRYRRRAVPPIFASTLLAAAVVLGAALAWTAHLGGQIRHPELSGVASSTAPAGGEMSEVEPED